MQLPFLSITIVLAVLYAGCSSSQIRMAESDLDFAIELEKSTFLVGEVGEFVVSLRNASDEQVICHSMTIQKGFLSIALVNQDGVANFGVHRSLSLHHPDFDTLMPYASAHIHRTLLPAYGKDPKFRDYATYNHIQPGIYRLRAVYDGGTTRFTSERQISIVAPVGEDMEAWELLKKFDSLSIHEDTLQVAVCESLIARYPKSIYTSRALLRLFYYVNFRGRGTHGLYPEHIAWRMIKTCPDSFEVEFVLGAVFEGMPGRSRKILEEIVRTYPDTRVGRLAQLWLHQGATIP